MQRPVLTLLLGLACVGAVYTPLPKPFEEVCVVEKNQDLYRKDRAKQVKW